MLWKKDRIVSDSIQLDLHLRPCPGDGVMSSSDDLWRRSHGEHLQGSCGVTDGGLGGPVSGEEGPAPGRLAGERLPRWLPLAMAAVGLLGSVVTVDLAAASDEEISSTGAEPSGPSAAADDASADRVSVDRSSTTTEAQGPGTDADSAGTGTGTESGTETDSTDEGTGAADDGTETGTATDTDSSDEGTGAAEDEPAATGGDGQRADCPPLFMIRFPLGSAMPMTDLGSEPAALASWLAEHTEASLLLDGHADAAGSEQANLALSFRRAEAAAAVLIQAGIAADRLQPRGFGEYQPLPGIEPDSERNRRVTMQVPGYEQCPMDDKDLSP